MQHKPETPEERKARQTRERLHQRKTETGVMTTEGREWTVAECALVASAHELAEAAGVDGQEMCRVLGRFLYTLADAGRTANALAEFADQNPGVRDVLAERASSLLAYLEVVASEAHPPTEPPPTEPPEETEAAEPFKPEAQTELHDSTG